MVLGHGMSIINTMPRPATGALEQALDARDRQWANARRADRKELNDLLADPENGHKLRRFRSAINNFNQLDAGHLMEQYVEREVQGWLNPATADKKWRYAALRAVGDKSVAIRLRHGLPEFEDNLSGDPENDNVFFKCKRMLGL